MADSIRGYPRFEGTLRATPAIPVIAREELRRMWDNFWGRLAFTLALGWGIFLIGSVSTLARARGAATVHTYDQFLNVLDQTRWMALAVAAIMAGQAFLEDQRRGALELYLSRAVTHADYYVGKSLAALGATWATVAIPGLSYWALSWFLLDKQPDRWAWVPLGVILYALLWAVVVVGLGFGLAALARSGRSASLILFGALAFLDLFVNYLLEPLTFRSGNFWLLSPLAMHAQQRSWIFSTTRPFAFDPYYALAILGVLAVVGWAVFVWRRPKMRGVE